MLKRLEVGVIRKPHALRGEVKVYVTSDDPERFESLASVIVDGKCGEEVLEVERVRYVGSDTVVKFRGIDTIEAVTPYVGKTLLIDRKDALPLREGQYFIGDLVGCDVYLEDGKKLGMLADIFPTGANDVYEVSKEEGGTILIPAIPDCLKVLAPEEGRIVVHLLPGLE